MWFFLILLFINTILLQAALSPADTFFKKKNCDSQCIFNKELSLESISSFPTNCSRVCTFLSLNEYSGINESKLTNLFKNVKVLIGGLSVSNTAFTSLKFLAPLEGIECSDDVGINIQNNNEMVDTGLINLKTIDCPTIFISAGFQMTGLNVPKLERVYSNTIDEIIFKNNSEELLLDPFLCYGLRNVLSMDNEDAPTFDGETCEQVEKSAPERNVTYMDGKSKSATMVNNFHECFDFLVSVVIFVVTQL
uniref:Recep_L_domain domain-containing protein n=1 Tax=Caenorhabditis tropicalis TaxID=1561998 RepID=A0A1I7UEK1_9PELO